jgi:hypothetical protein
MPAVIGTAILRRSSFIVNKDLIKTFPPTGLTCQARIRKQRVAFGDPIASNQATQGVYAAGLGR